jgi:hypothetical protein
MSDSGGRRGTGAESGSDVQGGGDEETAPGETEAEEEEEEEREWRFGLDEVGEDAADAGPGARPKEPMEPGSVSLENAAFVLVGALGTLLLFWLLATP